MSLQLRVPFYLRPLKKSSRFQCRRGPVKLSFFYLFVLFTYVTPIHQKSFYILNTLSSLQSTLFFDKKSRSGVT